MSAGVLMTRKIWDLIICVCNLLNLADLYITPGSLVERSFIAKKTCNRKVTLLQYERLSSIADVYSH